MVKYGEGVNSQKITEFCHLRVVYSFTPLLHIFPTSALHQPTASLIQQYEQWYLHVLSAASHPRPTQPSIPPGSVNEYQLRLGRQRQVWFIPLTRAIPERLRGVFTTRRYTNTRLPCLTEPLLPWNSLPHDIRVADSFGQLGQSLLTRLYSPALH